MSHETTECEVVLTRGGAPAMLDRATGEVMHPVVGPLIEGELLYLAPSRLRERLSEAGSAPVVLFDVGLGAGSNAALAFRAAAEMEAGSRRLSIVSFENSLAAFSLALTPAHGEAFGFEGEVLDAATEVLRTGHFRSARVEWRLCMGDLLQSLALPSLEAADVVFWDPFSPRANPALWTVSAFRLLRAKCRPGVSVHTYSGKTAVRSALLLAGFAVGFGPATGEKSQTTCAALAPADLAQPLDQRWLERLTRSSAPLPDEAPEGALEIVRGLSQFNREDERTNP